MRIGAAIGFIAAVTIATGGYGLPARAEASLFDRVGAVIGLSNETVLGDGGLASALAVARQMTPRAKAPVLALHVTPEGHFEFSTAAGESYTAGTSAELTRAAAVLMPGVVTGLRGATIVLSADSLFAGAEALRRLPDAASLHVAIAGQGFALERRAGGWLAVRIGRSLILAVEDKSELREAIAQLRRPIDARRVAVLSARETPERRPITTGQSVAASAGQVEVLPVDADRLAEAISALPRRTVLVTTKLVGQDARLELPSGRVMTVPIAELTAAARSADVDLIFLDTDPPRQQGGRTWLLGQVSIAGAERAGKARLFLDVLDPLAEARGGFDVRIAKQEAGSVRLVAEPAAVRANGVTGWVGAAAEVADVLTGEFVGTLKPRAVVGQLVPETRRRELALRLVPGVPSLVQWVYAGLLLAGSLGWRTARVWWRGLWPLEKRGEYAGALGYFVARLVRFGAFVVFFLPLAGLPAAFAGLFRRKRKPVAA